MAERGKPHSSSDDIRAQSSLHPLLNLAPILVGGTGGKEREAGTCIASLLSVLYIGVPYRIYLKYFFHVKKESEIHSPQSHGNS